MENLEFLIRTTQETLQCLEAFKMMIIKERFNLFFHQCKEYSNKKNLLDQVFNLTNHPNFKKKKNILGFR